MENQTDGNMDQEELADLFPWSDKRKDQLIPLFGQNWCNILIGYVLIFYFFIFILMNWAFDDMFALMKEIMKQTVHQ